jgi:hypothetical protein
MELSKRLSNKIQENRALIDQAKLDRDKILELGDKISAQANHIGEIEEHINKDRRLQEQGYCVMAVDNEGYVTEAVNVPAYGKRTYTQPINKLIGTAPYNNCKFIKDENGTMKPDKQKYKKFIGGYTL